MSGVHGDHNRITVYLTDRAPLSISKDGWPTLAKVYDRDDVDPATAMETAWVRVRREKDHGVFLVHGMRLTRAEPRREVRAGFLVKEKDGEALTEAVHKVCALVGVDSQKVFDKLPAEEA